MFLNYNLVTIVTGHIKIWSGNLQLQENGTPYISSLMIEIKLVFDCYPKCYLSCYSSVFLKMKHLLWQKKWYTTKLCLHQKQILKCYGHFKNKKQQSRYLWVFKEEIHQVFTRSINIKGVHQCRLFNRMIHKYFWNDM